MRLELRHLDAADGRPGFTHLPDFFCELVSDLEPLRTLTALTELELTKCALVSNLEPLRILTGLTNLKLCLCKSVSDLEPLRTLTGLTRIDLSACRSSPGKCRRRHRTTCAGQPASKGKTPLAAMTYTRSLSFAPPTPSRTCHTSSICLSDVSMLRAGGERIPAWQSRLVRR